MLDKLPLQSNNLIRQNIVCVAEYLQFGNRLLLPILFNSINYSNN